MNKTLLCILSLSLLASCSGDVAVDDMSQGGDGVAVEFSAVRVTTRVSGESWSINDRVGIFSSEQDENLEYYVSSAATGELTPASRAEQIFVADQSSVDYVAYYPYASTTTRSSSVTLDLRDQSDLMALEVLRAEVNGVEGSLVELDFERMLAKLSLSFSISGTDGSITTLEGGSVVLSGAALYGEYTPYTGVFGDYMTKYTLSLPLVVSADGLSATTEALVIPLADLSRAKITLAAESANFIYNFADNSDITKWESGCESYYEIEL